MAKHLYALLVGINEYDERSRVPWLKGCVNDIVAMQAYLKSSVSERSISPNEVTLSIQTLLNEQATRQNIIEGFRQHLAQAGETDVVLFYYAGHGAQALAPEAFWPSSPDRMMETLVCHDSRIDHEHWDLADKELAQLIAEVGQRNPHITVVLDCCHSGSGTREAEARVAIRKATVDERQRPLESFMTSSDGAHLETILPKQENTSGTYSLSPAARLTQLSRGRHVVLAACQNIEEAREYLGADVPRGAFSYFLQSTLLQTRGSISYRDLFKRTRALILSESIGQSPQLDATHSQDLEQAFLGGAIAPQPPYFTVNHHPSHGWVIDGGAVHGVQRPTDDETTALALFPFDSAGETLNTTASAIAQAHVTQVLPQLSKIESAALSDTKETYKAVVVSSPIPRLPIFLEGDSVGIESLQQAIAVAGPASQPSLYVQVTKDLQGAKLRVVAEENTYRITSPTEMQSLTAPVQGFDTDSATTLVEKVEHIARWRTIAELASPANHQIQGGVALKIYTGDEPSYENATEITDTDLRLTYLQEGASSNAQDNSSWQPPRFRVQLHNNSNKTLYCAVFYLTEQFSVDVIQPDGVANLIRLLPDQTMWLGNGAALNGRVPDALWQQGITESHDRLKIIACTDEFDPTLMTLNKLGLPAPATRSIILGGSLNRLMASVTTRDIGFAEDVPNYDEWVTTQVAFTFVRPQPLTLLSAEQSVDIGSSAKLLPHPTLSAAVRLTTVGHSTRDLGSAILPPLLQNKTAAFQFTQSRASDPGLSALELSNVDGLESVTAENPLIIEAQMPLAADEYVLPIAYDGEFYLPLGYGKTACGTTRIVIERLSQPMCEGSRSVGGSIRIFFQKVVTKKLGDRLSQKVGIGFEYPLLREVQLETTDHKTTNRQNPQKVNYINDLETIRKSVAAANTVVIYIHGIFGDTESMLPSLETSALADNTTSVGTLYDLVLAFDYENLNTTIDQNARLLKSRLEAIGLGTGHEKTVHIVAHSMGGLVSRWFIEQEGGNDIVSHLMMLGTPNDGSPWPQVQAGITAAVAFAINGLLIVATPLKILEGLLTRIETVDVSLDQMQPGSEFLAELSRAKDPGIPYTLVVGNTSLIEVDSAAKLRQKLMQRLGQLVELPFFGLPNDIAVSVESITAIPAGRVPAPRVLSTACNHLEYFVHPAGLAALMEAVVGAVNPATKAVSTVETSSPGQIAAAQEADGPAIQQTLGLASQSAGQPTEGKRLSKVWLGVILSVLLVVLLIVLGGVIARLSPNQPSERDESPSDISLTLD